MPIRIELPVSVLALVLASATAMAAALVDERSGLSVDPPEGFIASRAQSQGYDVTIGVDSASGTPRRGPEDAHLCQIGFHAIAANKQFSQAEINDLWLAPAWQEKVRATMDRTYVVSSQTQFELKGAAGMEFVGRPIGGTGADRITTSLSLIETPPGRVVVVCVTLNEDFTAALPQFRAIRDTIQPPK